MSRFKLLAAALAAVVISGPVLAQDENAVDPQYTWDLGDIFPSVEAWDAARQEVLDALDEIEQRRGSLGKSADDLFETLELVSDTQRKAGNDFVYVIDLATTAVVDTIDVGPGNPNVVAVAPQPGGILFADGFETGDTSAWSRTEP